MQTSPVLDHRAATATRGNRAAGRLVIDAPTRVFHWLFAACFTGAYLTADSETWRAMHITLGYTLAGLLAFRVGYGLWGPRHAGLGGLWRRATGALAWCQGAWRTLRGDAVPGFGWRQGQNLLMAVCVLAVLLLVLPLSGSGYVLAQDSVEGWIGELLEALHEGLANAVLTAALVHVGLIALLSLLRRKNQARQMLTGRVDGTGPDLVRRNPVWLAALLLACAAAFIGWRWHEAPEGLWPTESSAQGHHGGRAERHDDD